MNLFGCKFCKIEDGVKTCKRTNFDSLLWSTITVFQVRYKIWYEYEFKKYTHTI